MPFKEILLSISFYLIKPNLGLIGDQANNTELILAQKPPCTQQIISDPVFQELANPVEIMMLIISWSFWVGFEI